MKEKLLGHLGHNIEVAYYGTSPEDAVSVTVECIDCNEVVIAAEDFE